MRLYNTLTRTKEEFTPFDPLEVKMYTCGPTVYDYVTVGNFRAYVTADILRRGLEFNGYKVRHVMNITDVGHLVSNADTGEDKLEKGARREGKGPLEVARFYEKDFLKKASELNLLEPYKRPRASEHIGEMIELIKRLEEKGFTYVTKNGVYFDIGKFPHYEELARCDLSLQIKAARRGVVVDESKKNPCDFRLWQLNQPQHILQWESPWGRGYPGWHIECSAMSMKYLGEQLDLHTGGEDLIFPHHTNEIAQSEAATGRRFVKCWVHNAFLLVDGGRMGKSLGNAYTVDDIKAHGFDVLALRYFYFTAHYRSQLNFTWDALAAGQNALNKLRESVRRFGVDAVRVRSDRKSSQSLVNSFASRFKKAVNDDLDMPQALAVVWEAVKSTDLSPAEKLNLIGEWDKILGLDLVEKTKNERQKMDFEVRELIARREKLRQEGEFEQADEIRDKLREMGYQIEDTPTGTRAIRKRKS
ncbi:cysteine--tRNA ligase [candidate division CPR3 bacterium 4484_211]|uniref:Cysteine--tRNA ligase n=1 Tax=candidate division CPR3 bacterium 4484_211 TaxID=1968527 RepID=A0A1W9NY32_UNCC3|nr:MAG: cysteine--tRNA ligase [candidate division CPR3 bacterium 4484_211]